MQIHRSVHRGRNLLVAAALAIGVAACGSDDGGAADSVASGDDSDAAVETSAGSSANSTIITVGLDGETNAWRPGVANIAAAGYNVAYSIYDPLVVRAADGSYQPYLAASIEANEDYTVWTVTLRDGVTFHDGTPLNADALLSNFTDYLMDDESEVSGDDQLGQVDELVVVDDLTVEYRLQAPNAVFPDILTTEAGMPFSPTAAAADPNGEQPVGTGPFVFEKWVRDSELSVMRNEDYWQDGQPQVAGVTFRPIPDGDIREQALAAGDLDAMLSLTGSSTLGDVDGVNVIRRPGNVAAAVLFNTTAPPFDDARVRRALSTAIDSEELMIVSDAEGTERANQMFGPDSQYYSEAAAQVAADLSNDPDAAAAELQGYLDDASRSDGRSPGDPLSITLHCASSPASMAVAQFYQSEWNDIGVEVEISPVESATLQAQARSKEYQAQCYRVGKEFDAGRALSAAFGAESSQNFTGYTNPEVTALLDELQTVAEPSERVDIVEQISVILAEEVPQLYAAPTVATWAFRDGITGTDTWQIPDGAEGAYPVYLGTIMWSQVSAD